MNQQLKAKIFLADERVCIETERYRSYKTFSSVNDGNRNKQPFDDLYVLDDNTLAPGSSVNATMEESSYVFLLPVVGVVSYRDSFCNTGTVTAGQLKVSFMEAGSIIGLQNPLENELINILQIRVKAVQSNAASKPIIINFDLDENKNKLIPLTSGFALPSSTQCPLLSIGKFDGRKEGVYRMKDNNNRAFVFVIQGVFEVQGRLLHARDGLALWDVDSEIELEALSNDAIVVMIESNKSNLTND